MWLDLNEPRVDLLLLVTGAAGAAAALARDFLSTGVMPGAQNDSQVTVISPGGVRGPVPDPYDVPTGTHGRNLLTFPSLTMFSQVRWLGISALLRTFFECLVVVIGLYFILWRFYLAPRVPRI